MTSPIISEAEALALDLDAPAVYTEEQAQQLVSDACAMLEMDLATEREAHAATKALLREAMGCLRDVERGVEHVAGVLDRIEQAVDAPSAFGTGTVTVTSIDGGSPTTVTLTKAEDAREFTSHPIEDLRVGSGARHYAVAATELRCSCGAALWPDDGREPDVVEGPGMTHGLTACVVREPGDSREPRYR